MRFNNIESNENLINRLNKAVQENRISHAYVLEGSSCIDKKAFAESFVKGILCTENLGENCGRCGICSKIDHENHEDIMYISSHGTSIKDADIIAMQERIKIKPFGSRHVVIIEGGDTMTIRAQNRLLKTLEEPPGDSIIIILSENMQNLVPTIQSRCVKYRINYFGSASYDFMMEKAAGLAQMVLDKQPFYIIKKEAENLMGDSEETDALLDSLQMYFRNLLLNQKNEISPYKDELLINNIYAVETARKQIKVGVSRGYAIKNMLLKIGG